MNPHSILFTTRQPPPQSPPLSLSIFTHSPSSPPSPASRQTSYPAPLFSLPFPPLVLLLLLRLPYHNILALIPEGHSCFTTEGGNDDCHLGPRASTGMPVLQGDERDPITVEKGHFHRAAFLAVAEEGTFPVSAVWYIPLGDVPLEPAGGME